MVPSRVGHFWEEVPRSSRFSNKKAWFRDVFFLQYRKPSIFIYFGKLPFRFVEGNSYHKLALIWQKKGTVKLQRRGSSEKKSKRWNQTCWSSLNVCNTPQKFQRLQRQQTNHLRHKAPPWQTGRVRFRGVSRAHSWGCGSSNCSWLKGHPKMQAFKLLKNLTPIPQKPHVFFFESNQQVQAWCANNILYIFNGWVLMGSMELAYWPVTN